MTKFKDLLAKHPELTKEQHDELMKWYKKERFESNISCILCALLGVTLGILLSLK